ncbi:rhodanese-like domain-containing protein [Deinococcus navajonensis]|uniref:Rhodanese-like domain-containing protein n=1 Tax=Deinococcus navajonensis TaxID=309884 RepID=A0ABV8XHQ7_9DEIO
MRARREALRIHQDEVKRFIHTVREGAGALVDVRSPEEYRGYVTHMPGYPQEGVMRGGHIPGAVNLPWAMAVKPDGTLLRNSSGTSTKAPESRRSGPW